jgi:large subunit ribosomal protein L13
VAAHGHIIMANMRAQRTHIPSPEEIRKAARWYVIDASGKTLGRVATLAAHVLRGKHKAIFTPHVITGDVVVIVNAEKVRVTGKKLDQKIYYRHTGYPGGIKTESLRQVLAAHPERALETAIKGMLPKNATGLTLMTRLKVYAGPEHPHKAQNPEPLAVPGRE